MLRSASRELVFGRTFVILSWNLMSRAANTVSICYSHLEWREDSLRIYFAHMNNDQGGSRPRDPRHVYANPMIPEPCPILALGIYWATYGLDEVEGKLFPGSNQYERFRKSLSRVLASPVMDEELRRRGLAPADIGTHSLRKGAATHISSGSTACPSAIAVHLRAGWAMGGVQDRYLRHDGAGDMHVGRTVCGLPSDDAAFAMLPSRFHSQSDTVLSAKRLCFPGLPTSLNGVGEYALASLLYHLPFLRRELPPTHPLFECPLFSNEILVNQVRQVRVSPPDDNADITATGIPPHVKLLGQICHIEQNQDGLANKVIVGVTKVLEERAAECGVPTCDRLAERVIKELHRQGYTRRQDETLQQEADQTITSDPTVQCWGGQLHTFPPGVSLPTGTVEQAWVCWCCGDQMQRLPPFRHLKSSDLQTKNDRKWLSDYRYLIKRIDERARSLGLQIDQISMTDAAIVYEQCKDVVSISASTDRGRKRRHVQLVWLTVATEIRKVTRVQQPQQSTTVRGEHD